MHLLRLSAFVSVPDPHGFSVLRLSTFDMGILLQESDFGLCLPGIFHFQLKTSITYPSMITLKFMVCSFEKAKDTDIRSPLEIQMFAIR